MFIQWQSEFDIGVPEIDAEHKYLAALINNLHDAQTTNAMDDRLPDLFDHLLQYVDTHFENEELLMKAGNYPHLKEHKKEHHQLANTAFALNRQFLAGKESINQDILAFLKTWLLEHVLDEDQKIGDYYSKHGVPEHWLPEAVSSDVFKQCSMCGKRWETLDDLQADKNKALLGCQPDARDPRYSLILFNCSCDTTLAMQLREFADHRGASIYNDERRDNNDRPDYCLNLKLPSCPIKCACAYTKDVLTMLG